MKISIQAVRGDFVQGFVPVPTVQLHRSRPARDPRRCVQISPFMLGFCDDYTLSHYIAFHLGAGEPAAQLDQLDHYVRTHPVAGAPLHLLDIVYEAPLLYGEEHDAEMAAQVSTNFATLIRAHLGATECPTFCIDLLNQGPNALRLILARAPRHVDDEPWTAPGLARTREKITTAHTLLSDLYAAVRTHPQTFGLNHDTPRPGNTPPAASPHHTSED